MKISEVKNKKVEANKQKTLVINIRVTPEAKKWLIDNDISPTLLFWASLKEVGYEASK